MDKKAIRKVVDLRFRRLNKLYARMEDAFDKEVIHHFRVEFKKLRAFLRLLRQEDHYNKIKIPRLLRDVYREAGKVRDLQLHKERIESDKASPVNPRGHLCLLSKKLTTAQRRLKKVMKPALMVKAQRKTEEKLPEQLTEDSMVNFVSVKMSGIRDIISRSNLTDKDLHTVRKYLKDIIYVAGILEKDLLLPFPIKDWNPEKEKQFSGLAIELGKFQDCCASLAHLRKDLQVAKAGTERKLIRGIHREQLRVKRELKLTIKEKCADPDHFRL